MQNGGLRTKGITKTFTPEKPLITVVTVVYNGAATLEQTIQSVVNQTYDNVEYIIIDGASSDGTLDIIKKYEDKIDYWQSEPDKGIYDAMNKGIGLATGEYIYILGCDDWLFSENTFSEVINYLKQGYDVVSGKVYLVYKNGYQKKINNNLNLSRNEDIALSNISAPHQGLFVRKLAMEKYPFDTKYKIAADFKSLLNLWYDNEILIKKIDYIIAFYSNEGFSGKSSLLRKKENFDIIKELELGNTGWGKKVGATKSITRFLKDFITKIGLRKMVVFLLHIYDFCRKKTVKHSCAWSFCRYCQNKSGRKIIL